MEGGKQPMSESGSRWLDTDATVRYLSLRNGDALRRLVREGRVPKPDRSLGERNPRWDRDALDAIFTGGAVRKDTRMVIEDLVRRYQSEGRPRRPKE